MGINVGLGVQVGNGVLVGKRDGVGTAVERDEVPIIGNVE
jgi:hypothetical protein